LARVRPVERRSDRCAGRFDEMTRILHDDRPTLIDSASGLLLWPVELVGALQNPMKLVRCCRESHTG
jgi:hypothetical protein